MADQRMEKIHLIRKLWEEHKCEKFPKIMTEELDVIDLVLLDGDVAGCIDTFLGCRYTLNISRTVILKSCYRELSRSSAKLSGVPRDYFQRLETLARLVIEVLTEGKK